VIKLDKVEGKIADTADVGSITSFAGTQKKTIKTDCQIGDSLVCAVKTERPN